MECRFESELDRQAAITALDKVYSVAASGSGYVARSARQAILNATELSSIGSSILLSMLIDDNLRYISDPSHPNAPVDTVNPRHRLTADMFMSVKRISNRPCRV
jgi:hypothetical protein